MRGRAASLWLLLACAVALAACSSDSGKLENPNLFPTDYKKEIVDALKKFFRSNETIKVTDAVISDPVLQPAGKEQRYTACVRYTAHGAEGNMVGNAVRIAYFYGGHLNQLIPANDGHCGNAAYKPFRELNEICLGKACK